MAYSEKQEDSWKVTLAILERQAAIYISSQMAQEMIQRAEVKVYLDDMLRDTIRMHIRWEVAANKATDPLEVPTSWWQHLKADHFPAWALKRWPVKMKRWWAYMVLPSVKLPEKDLLGGFKDWLPHEGRPT